MKDNRLFRILYYILEKEKVTANELADKFEVSVRTIYRDIDSISSVGVPIFTTQGKGGGIKIDNEFILNKSLFDTNEKEQIIAALQGLEKTNEAYKSELITFDSITNSYRILGEKVGQAFKDGAKIK